MGQILHGSATTTKAVRLCNELATYSPSWIEEPILSDDVDGHAHLRKSTSIPIALGEQLGNRFDFWNYVRANAVDIVQPNVWKVGGITEWMKIAHMHNMQPGCRSSQCT